MIPKTRKLMLRSDRQILYRGERLRGKLMEIFTQNSDLPRAAVIVGKNVSLLATQRNLIKRRITAALVRRLNGAARDVVVRALSPARSASYEQLESELNQLLSAK